jgi:DNA-binding phage protein
MRELDTAAIISLLRADIKRVGGVAVWSKKQRIDRTVVAKALSGSRPPTKRMIKALGLRIIVVSDGE